MLDADDFDRFVEGKCVRFYAPVMGRWRLPPLGTPVDGYFEGIDSEPGFGRRASDSLAVRAFTRLPVDEQQPNSHDDFPDAAGHRPRESPRRLHSGAARASGGGPAQG
jgi:hypothetical protein